MSKKNNFATSKKETKYTFGAKTAYFPNVVGFEFFDEDKNKKTYYKEIKRNKNDLFYFMLGWQKIKNKTFDEIRKMHGHPIKDEKFKFSNKEIEEQEAFQVKLPSFKEGRIIGFLDGNDVFQVVKFDREHQIYKDKKFN